MLPPITPRPERASGARFPLSFAQQRLWLVEQLAGPDPALVIPFALRLEGTLDAEALRGAFEAVIERHEVLRTGTFVDEGDGQLEPWQAVLPPPRFELPVSDLSGGDVPEDRLRERLDAHFAAPFDLRSPPLVRAQLFRLAPAEHVLAVSVHHIAVDAWSVAILVDDLMAAYRTALSGAPRPPGPALQYADYAIWQRRHLPGEIWQRQMDYWRQTLAGSPTELTLPGAVSTNRGPAGVSVGRVRQQIARADLDALGRLAEQHDATLFVLLYAALNVVLRHQADRDDILVGTDVANRERPETEAMVGFFVNQLVLRCRLDGVETLSDVIKEARRVVLDACQHQDLPFDALVAELLPERQRHDAPLFQVKLILQNIPTPDLELPGLSVAEIPLGARAVEVDLLVNASVGDEGLELLLDYRADRYPERVIAEVAALLTKTLRLLGAPEKPTLKMIAEALDDEKARLRQAAGDRAREARDHQRAALGTARRKPVGLQGGSRDRSDG
jgi:hypothetical protein